VAFVLPLLLAGCSALGVPLQETPAAGAEPSYNLLIANQLKSLFKDHASSYEAFEIAGLRWVNTLKGWSWLACVRFQDHGHRRVYALFIKDGVVIDNRYAVETDACDAQAYSPFDLATGALRPTSIGVQEPLY
jgi:hypothetical protein